MAPRGRGFTLIEIMVAVGIVAILALMTIPAFMDQYIRNQIADALPLADIAKAPVAWVCGYAQVPGNMTAQGENRTNIPANYLPVSCREI